MAYTTNWHFTDNMVVAQPITEVSTTQKLPLGSIRRARDFGSNQNGEGEFIYLKGVASTVAGSWVNYNADDYSTALIAANAIGPVAVAMAATVASTYGWYQISGKAVAKVAAGYADNTSVWYQASGVGDDTAVTGDRIQRAKGASAIDVPATGYAEFEIERPFMDDAVGAG